MAIKTFYKVNNLEFDNLKDAETFDSYLKSFDKKQMKELYMGCKAKINYKVYLDPKLDYTQMEQIRIGLSNNLDVSIYAKPYFNWQQIMLSHILIGNKCERFA